MQRFDKRPGERLALALSELGPDCSAEDIVSVLDGVGDEQASQIARAWRVTYARVGGNY